MVEDLDQWQALVGFVDEDFVDQVLVVVREPGLVPNLPSHDLV